VSSGVFSFAPLRIYLDANVLFSASYVATSRFLDFWRMAGFASVTSPYAIDEVRRNIKLPGQHPRFDALLTRTSLVSDAAANFVPDRIRLVDKDRPILAAAIAAGVDYLVTGDKTHFAHLYSSKSSHVSVISPGEFLDRYEDRLIP
jgi:uncharacterized protein